MTIVSLSSKSHVLHTDQLDSYGVVEYTPQAYLPGDLDLFFKNFSSEQVGQRPIFKSIDGGVLQTQVESFGYNGESVGHTFSSLHDLLTFGRILTWSTLCRSYTPSKVCTLVTPLLASYSLATRVASPELQRPFPRAFSHME